MEKRLYLLLPALLFVLSAYGFASAFGGDGAGCGAGACSECHSLSQEEAEKLLTGLVDKVHSVEFAIVPGLWTVGVEGQGKQGSVYIDFSKSFAISGKAFRLKDWSDVTAEAAGPGAAAPKKVDAAAIPLGDAIVLGAPEAEMKVVVFTDPQCPYCKKLHEELDKVVASDPGIAFYMKLYPLASHPESYGISKSIVCAKSLELLEKSFADEKVPDPSCETDAIDETVALAKELGISSTPTLVLPDGRVLSGYKPAEKLLEILRAPPE